MNEEKRIEEIALDLNHIIHFKDNGLVARYATAEAMYELGYHKQSEWISVEDKLPEDLETVLALCKDGGMFVGRYARYISCGKWEIWTAMKSTRTVSRRVTHWMPLPPPPTEKEN